MGQVRWAGWTMAIATALVISGAHKVRADVASDKPAAIVIYPKIVVDVSDGTDTVVRLTNTHRIDPILVHCFYLDANSHCHGGTREGDICTSDTTICSGGGVCVPSWNETDFRIVLTPNQPISWKAADGLADSQLPLASGFCKAKPNRACGSDADCNPFPGGECSFSNAGTRIPPVPENPFIGELKCIAIDNNGAPTPRNDLKGEAILENVEDLGTSDQDFDVASYNAIGIQSTGVSSGAANELTLGGENAEYNGCPNFLILDHFFDEANDPVPGSNNIITTDLVLVPCSEDLLRQIPGAAVIQYLVFNEFEQRFSTSNTARCFQEIQLCHIDRGQCTRSIFNVGVAGTLTGQTRLQPLGIPPLPSGMLGIAIEHHDSTNFERSAAFNLVNAGSRDTPDTITIP